MADEKSMVSLGASQEELEQRLLTETDINQLKDIINIFNLNIQRKNIIRTSKLSDLQDKVFTQMSERLDNEAADFSNQDLLNYFKTIQDTISKNDTTLDKVDIPAIQIQQNQLNVNLNGEELNRESRAKVLDVIQSIIGLENTVDTTFMEVVENEPVKSEQEGR